MNSLQSLQRDLDRMKLKLSTGDLSAADFDLLMFIIDGFFDILKFLEGYPVSNFIQVYSRSQFNTRINSQSSKARVLDIFRSMEGKPQQSTIDNSELTYTCDICDEKIQILNNDHLFSLHMHEQTPHHKEVLMDFQNLHTEAVSFNSNGSYANTTRLNGKLRCTVCNVEIPNCEQGLVDHNRGYKHRLNLVLGATSSNSIVQPKVKLVVDSIKKCSNTSQVTKNDNTIQGTVKMNPPECTSKESDSEQLSVNKACIIFNQTGSQYCILCKVLLTNPLQSEHHLTADRHRLLVKEQLLTAKANSLLFTTGSVLFDIGIIFINKNGDRRCFLCNIKFSKNAVVNYASHLKGRNHNKKLKLQIQYNK